MSLISVFLRYFDLRLHHTVRNIVIVIKFMIIIDDHISHLKTNKIRWCDISPRLRQTNRFYYIWMTSFVTHWPLENNNSYLDIALSHTAMSSTFLSSQPDYDESSFQAKARWRQSGAKHHQQPELLVQRQTDGDRCEPTGRLPAESFTVIQHEVLWSNWGSVLPD